MKKLIFLIVVGGLIYVGLGLVRDYRADMMVDQALAFAEVGNYAMALKSLDSVDSLFPKTPAAERTEEVRAQILQMERDRKQAEDRVRKEMAEQGRKQRKFMEEQFGRPPTTPEALRRPGGG